MREVNAVTYGEFEREVKKLGLGCDYNDFAICVLEPYTHYPIAWVSRIILNTMKTTSDISQLSESVDYYKLSTLCYELAITPLDGRETVVLD